LEIILKNCDQPPATARASVKCMQLENSGSVVKMPRHLLKIIV